MKDDITVGEITKDIERTSNSFELAESELKRRYLIWNMFAFNTFAGRVDDGIATFGTGYPFYVLDSHLQGKIPIISEQIRYNRQLVKDGEPFQLSIYECKRCLDKNYSRMRDLKANCIPCPRMSNLLKPRKLINRLPDMDLWLICRDKKMNNAQQQLETVLQKNGMVPSDINPIYSIEKVEEIAKILKEGEMPAADMYLPIDAHIVEFSEIKRLISSIPKELKKSKKTGIAPYIPIHPKSLRKKWQYDDTAYNFVYDFLSAFTPFNFPEELQIEVDIARCIISNSYSEEELYQFLLSSATESNIRRLETPEVRKVFIEKVREWKSINIGVKNVQKVSNQER